jgi:hypothetical protein
MSDNKCNGWSNYATWRVNLEIISDIGFEETENINVDYLKELVEDIVFSQHEESLMSDYAHAFLSEVNYHEILESILDEIEMNKQYENE